MPQSLSKIYLHVVFRIKYSSPPILEEHLPNLHAYIGEMINLTGCVNVLVGGVENHVHALCLLGREVSPSHLVKEIKRNSSRWIKTLSPHYENFAWQGGYGVFSVSPSVVDRTLQYIKNQRKHHKQVQFENEYLTFLKTYGINYDEKYVFED